ncbi:CSG1/SUR1-like protein [Teratosphaeriaceae sp. CCFEE 6253]|nr:CSG1/SUR1-like protein [Teratosphaeriaceae sp. CCFEE 6253]
MRRAILIFLLVNLAILGFLVHQVWILITLLFAKGLNDAITKAELPALGSDQAGDSVEIIPRIIHQTYKNASIPVVWQEAQASCIALHGEDDGWEYKLWTDAMGLEFIEQEYPWFLDTYIGYPYPIERADAIRYFVLAHYGGIYIDLDDGCNRPLTPLLSYPAFVRRTIPTGISNDVMGAVPRHPFFLMVIKNIKDYDRRWVLPYITVMGSTGPLFLSVMWRHWSSDGLNRDKGRVRLIFPEEYNGQPWSFFTHHVGNSWHGADVRLIFWLSRHWLLITILGFIVGFGVIFSGWWAYRRLAAGPAERPRHGKTSLMSKLQFWRRGNAHQDYELVNRHEV